MREMNFIPHLNFPERAKFFYEKYDVLEIIGTGEPKFNIRTLKKKNERVCRFCSKDNSETAFENDSHLISKFIGNTDLFSDFECDKCNSKFSEFETDLAYFIGVSRSITGLSEIGKAPSFVTRRLSVKSRSFAGENILILSKKDLNEENNLEDRKAGKTTITYNKPPYTPINVYKALVKAAISLLTETEVKSNYANVIEYLKGGYLFKGAHVYGYTLPFQ